MNIYCGFYALIIHFITGIPPYIDEENVEFIRLRRMGNPYWRLLKIFKKIGCHFSKGIFCVSELDKNLISAYFKVNKGKIRVIQNGFEFDKNKYKDLQDQSIRSCNGLESNEKAVLFSEIYIISQMVKP